MGSINFKFHVIRRILHYDFCNDPRYYDWKLCFNNLFGKMIIIGSTVKLIFIFYIGGIVI
jgi:hypothetical protein